MLTLKHQLLKSLQWSIYVINSINNAKLMFNLESIALSTGPLCFSLASQILILELLSSLISMTKWKKIVFKTFNPPSVLLSQAWLKELHSYQVTKELMETTARVSLLTTQQILQMSVAAEVLLPKPEQLPSGCVPSSLISLTNQMSCHKGLVFLESLWCKLILYLGCKILKDYWYNH